MGNIIDLIGHRFGRLTVLSFYGKNKHNQLMWLCKCDCGKEKIIRGQSLREGLTQSCGCYNLEILSARLIKHGKIDTLEYISWQNMLSRCYNPNNPEYHNYMERGIAVCDRWRQSFENFYVDMGERPSPKHTLDRIDVNGNYEPNNCRWATMKEQNNNRRNNHLITYNNITKTISQWADELNIKSHTLSCRLSRGWSINRALKEPINTK